MPGELTWREISALVERRGNERWLAKRIQDERRKRHMSQQDLARAMSDAGCPIHQSAISKIEAPKGRERRSVSIAEAIAFGRVFEIPLGELLLPANALTDVEAWRRYNDAADLLDRQRDLRNEYERVVSWFVNHKISDEFVASLQTERLTMAEAEEAENRAIRERDGDDLVFDPPPAMRAIDDILAAVNTRSTRRKARR